MRYAIVQEGCVINVIEADPDHLPELPGVELVPSKTAGIGWTYADGTFKAPPELAPVQTSVVPQSVSRAQGKLALIGAGLWPAVIAFVDGITDPVQKVYAEVALNDTQEWRRDSPFLADAAASMGLTTAQLDALFIAAAQVVL